MAPPDGYRDFQRDNDSLYAMPLSMLPLRTPGLRRARLVKDSRLKTAIELFGDKHTGSGLIDLDRIGERFGWRKESDRATGMPVEHPDLVILRKLALQPSFDIYSLRIGLRDLGIDVDSVEKMQLSEEKRHELSEYMKVFTLPLIRQVYGEEGVDMENVDDVVKLFSDPDTRVALRKLKLLSSKLGIQLAEIPKFLEDFSDIYMSLAYYQQYVDDIAPKVTRFIADMATLRENWQLRQDAVLMRTCDELEQGLNNLTSSVSGRFESFNLHTADMWKEISAERFQGVKALITSYHTTIGGILCGLGLKMNTWASAFPTKDKGGPVSRGELIMNSIRPGLEQILKLNDRPPGGLGLLL